MNLTKEQREALKGCPFCGGTNIQQGYDYKFVMCNTCGASCYETDTQPESNCVVAWNRRAAPSADDAPSGWKLVPVEPTQGMLDAARWHDGIRTAKSVWDDMLAAAPTPEDAPSTAQGVALTDEQIEGAALRYCAHVVGAGYDTLRFDCAEDRNNFVREFAAAKPASVDAQPASGVDAWQPIETAPRDGTNLILRFGADGVSQAKFVPGSPYPWKFIDTNDGITWLVNHARDGIPGPTHWMPMPSGDLRAAIAQRAKEE